MTERCGWAWRATREVIVDEQQIDRNLCEERQFRTDQLRPSGQVCSIPCIMTGSAFSSLNFIWQIRPAIGPAVNSDNLRIIGPFLFVYNEWPFLWRKLAFFARNRWHTTGCLEPGLSKTLALPLLETWTAGPAERTHCRSNLREAWKCWTKALPSYQGCMVSSQPKNQSL